jgi:hypothetical protein
MVYSPKLTFIANHNNSTGIGLTRSKTICFDILEFTNVRFDHRSPSKGVDSSSIFIGMMHSGSPSLHTILEESSDEGGTASGEGGSSRSHKPRGCNMVTSTVPITTTLPPENTPTPITIPTFMVWIATLQPGIGTIPE